jgi:hypothetical protein
MLDWTSPQKRTDAALVHECRLDLTPVPLGLKLRQIRTPMAAAISEAHKKSYRHPKYKTGYRVSNWPAYEKSLLDRGDMRSFNWHSTYGERSEQFSGKRVGR